MAIATGLLAFLLSGFLLTLEPDSLPAHLVLYGGLWLACGVFVPWGYTLLVERAGLDGLGLGKARWSTSLAINLALGAALGLAIALQARPAGLQSATVARAGVVLIGAGGLFELFLYYGFIHLRLARAFGRLPAIGMSAALYVLWHVGTQLPLEVDPWAGALKLLGVGLTVQAVFSLTYHLAIIWPFFLGAGVMIDFLFNVDGLSVVSAGFEWALGTLALMLPGAVLIWLRSRALPRRSSGPEMDGVRRIAADP